MTLAVHRRLTAAPSRLSTLLLALLAWVPPLLTKPGRMVGDTKLFLYLNPGRLITDAPFTWDTRQFAGWVPHQTIAYLWPQGPWYWLCQTIGLPDWVAHRLWIGLLFFLAAVGVRWVAGVLGLARPAASVAAVVYMLSPYVLPYVSRTSSMLLTWVALPWIVGLTVRAATETQHRWRHPALLALVLLGCGAVNATAVMMIAPAPVLWLLHAVWSRTVTWRAAVLAALRIGVLSVGVSLWWVFMLRAQSTWGADVLSYSESLEATSFTTVSTEALRGMGYWLFYVRDPYAFTTTASQAYMESGIAIAISFGLTVTCLCGLALVRWTQRRFAALLVFAGVVLAVGVHPIGSPSPLMRPLAEHSRSSLALALRSSARALPLSTLGLALGAGALVAAMAGTRWRVRALAPALVVLLAVVNLPALFDGNLVDPALERDQYPPAAWQEAAGDLSSSSTEYRVLQLPGAEFGAFRWGYTSDPPLVGMTTKPLVTRDLLPLGSPGAMDLLYALDDRVQDGVLDTSSLAPVARFLGVDTVWLANDLAYDRYRTPLPAWFARVMGDAADLLGPRSYGTPVVNDPVVPMTDEHDLALQGDRSLAPVQLFGVDSPVPIVRTSDRVVVLVGSGDGVIDAAAAGLLRGDEALLYAADVRRVAGSLPAAATGAGLVVITDSNRDRAHHWRSSQDVTGFTEGGGDGSEVLHPDESDQRLPVFGDSADPADQTVALLDGGLVVRASGYGEPFAYRPEQRPAMAVDGDPTTAWVVADRQDPVGEYLTVSATDGSLTLLQPQDRRANRRITSVRITTADGGALDLALDDRSLAAPGQRVDLPDHSAVTITLTGVGAHAGGFDTGPSAVGFAEIGVGAHLERIRVPEYDEGSGPLAIVLSRLRTDPLERWRSDPEPVLRRTFTLHGDRSFGLTLTLGLDERADDGTIDALFGTVGAVSDRRLTGDPASRGSSATDDDPTTAWTTPFDDVVGASLTVPTTAPAQRLVLRQPLDDRHSTITAIDVIDARGTQRLDVPAPDATGSSTVVLPSPTSGPSFRLVVAAVDGRTTTDRRFAEQSVLPAAVVELSGEGIARTSTGAPTGAGCRDDLLTIDGTPVTVAIDEASLRRLTTDGSVDVGLCSGETVSLGAGTHDLESMGTTGIDVDRVVLRDAVTVTPAADAVRSVQRTRTTRDVEVGACPSGCWLVLGEGHNVGWTASVGGRDLGAPVQIAGGFNGWWLPAATSTTVHMEWTAQTPVTLALVASGATVVLCLALGRRRRFAGELWIADGPGFDAGSRAPVGLRRAAATAAAIVALSALVASPSWGVLALAPAGLVLATRRPRLAGIMAVALAAALAARVLQQQITHRFMAEARWPATWDRLHRPGLVVVVLLLAATLSRDPDR